MKNIIALRIPTFITRERGETPRLFSNFINDNRRKKIAQPISKSKSSFSTNESGLPKNILEMNSKKAERKNN